MYISWNRGIRLYTSLTKSEIIVNLVCLGYDLVNNNSLVDLDRVLLITRTRLISISIRHFENVI